MRDVAGERGRVTDPQSDLLVSDVDQGTILIFHDGFDARRGDRASAVAAVRMVIAGLTRRGYGFVTGTVDELLVRLERDGKEPSTRPLDNDLVDAVIDTVGGAR